MNQGVHPKAIPPIYFAEQRLTAEQTYREALERLFKSDTTGLLQVKHLKGSGFPPAASPRLASPERPSSRAAAKA